MKKILFITLSLLLLIALVLGEYFFKEGLQSLFLSQPNEQTLLTENKVLGSSTAPLKVKLIGIFDSRISHNFAQAFIEASKGMLESDRIQINLEYLGKGVKRTFNDVVGEESKNIGSGLIVLAPDVNMTQKSKEVAHQNQLLTILFSKNEDAVCINNEISPYLWNFDIPIKAATETFLSFLNQKYGKLAQDLRIFIYQNDDDQLSDYAKNLNENIKGLGMANAGTLIVDDRIDNLYSTIRQIFDHNPKVVIGLTSKKGGHSFIPVAAKLNLTYDIALTFLEGVREEDLVELGKSSRGILIPTPYVESEPNSGGGKRINGSSYQGLLVADILNKIFSLDLYRRERELNITQVFSKLDGVHYQGLAGLVTVDGPSHGLIQPLHVGQMKEDKLVHINYLGDVSLSDKQICAN